MKFKKLIPALCMLLVAAVLMGTSTFAWFSMNTQVTATGMQVVVKSNNVFLLIGTGDNDTADEIQAASPNTTVALTVDVDDSDVYPASPIIPAYVSDDATTNAAQHKYFANTQDVVEGATSAAEPDNWFTAQNNNPASANDSVKNVNNLTAFSDYVITKTAYLTLADGSDAANNLRVTATFADKDDTDTPDDISAVRVLIAISDYYVILTPAAPSANLYTTGTGAINHELADNAVLQADIYIYYDGEASVVNTNNIADLSAATISLAFDVDVA